MSSTPPLPPRLRRAPNRCRRPDTHGPRSAGRPRRAAACRGRLAAAIAAAGRIPPVAVVAYGSDDWVLGPPLMAALTSAAALSAILQLSGTGRWTGEHLRQLLDSSAADSWTPRNLSLDVVDLSDATLAPIGRLPRLFRVSLTAGPTVPGGVSVPDTPCLSNLFVSPAINARELVGMVVGVGGAPSAGAPPSGNTREELAAALLHAFSSPVHATLATLKVHSRLPPTRAVDAAAVAVAPPLPVLRHLTVGRAAWSFARGRVVSRFEPDPDPAVRVCTVLPPC